MVLAFLGKAAAELVLSVQCADLYIRVVRFCTLVARFFRKIKVIREIVKRSPNSVGRTIFLLDGL